MNQFIKLIQIIISFLLQSQDLIVYFPPIKHIPFFSSSWDNDRVRPGLRESKQMIFILVEVEVCNVWSQSVEKSNPHYPIPNFLQFCCYFCALLQKIRLKSNDVDIGPIEFAFLYEDEFDSFAFGLLKILLSRLEAKSKHIVLFQLLHYEALVLRRSDLLSWEFSNDYPQLLLFVLLLYLAEVDIIEREKCSLHVLRAEDLVYNQTIASFIGKVSQEGRLHLDLIDFVQVRPEFWGFHFSSNKKLQFFFIFDTKNSNFILAETRL